MMGSLVRALAMGFSLWTVGCGSAVPEPAPSPEPSVAAPLEAPGPDYLLVAPRRFLPALEPLVAHRERLGHRVAVMASEDAHARHGGGQPDAKALKQGIRAVWKESKGALRYVLLVGDIPRHDEPPDDRIAAFYLPKIAYLESDHRERHVFHRSLLHVEEDHARYPSDHPYGVMEGEPTDPAAPIAVGRVPARDADEARGFVEKLIAYETKRIDSTWPRRLVVHAGPARFGAFIDRVLERTALELLDQRVPYDFDVDVVFAKPDSPYTERLDRLGESLTERANRGAFLLAYVGHSSPAYFDTVEYRGQYFPIGSRDDFERMRIESGAPIFVSLSCDVGAFDMSKGRRSIAEEAVLNPFGAIAAFAATRESHPYPNLLYGEALIAQLIHARPETIGKGFAAVRRDMVKRVNLLGEQLSRVDTHALKREHVALYALFGDPATRLRYPDSVEVKLAGGDSYEAGEHVAIALAAPSVPKGRAVVTLELRRTDLRAPLQDPDALEQLPMDAALRAMSQNRASAVDKVLATHERRLEDGRGTLSIEAPARPGDYVVKVFALGDSETAWGHASFRVR